MQFDKRKKKRLLWWNVKRSKIAPPENCINVAEENYSRIKRRGNKYWEWLKKKCIRKNVEIDKAKSFANHIDNISLLNPLPLRPLFSHKFDTHCINAYLKYAKAFCPRKYWIAFHTSSIEKLPSVHRYKLFRTPKQKQRYRADIATCPSSRLCKCALRNDCFILWQ